MSLKEGQSTNRPLLLEGPNYAYWKSKMKAFLKSLDERAWRAVMIGWTEPMMANPEGAVMPKSEALWSEVDDVAAVGNSKALNAIFYGVDENVFKLIAECEVAKEAWDILRIAFEGPDKESNDEEEEHENIKGLVVTIEDCSETSKSPYSSALFEQPADDTSGNDEEELTHEALVETYMELHKKWLMMIGLNKKLTETVTSLTEEKDKLWQEVKLLVAQKVEQQEDISALKKELIGMSQECLSLLAQKVELLGAVSPLKIEDGHRGLGFNDNSGSDKTSSVKAKLKPAQRARQSVNRYPEKQLGNQGRKQLMPNRGRHGTEWRRKNRTCWYCYQMGHIKSRQVWKPKTRKEVCFVALSSFSHMKEECWYLDSGCSAHMTGNPQYLINVKPIRKRQFVTFGDGGKGQVIGCGTLKVPDLPELKDVLLVDRLKVNLISISRLCDEGQSVTFTRDSCQVLDRNGDTLMEGSRSSNKSYVLGIVGTGVATVSLINTINEIKYRELAACSSSPKNVNKAFIDEIWVVAIHVELEELIRYEAWK
ncbi:unnamed protein product [Rhodiola kirilowii]